MDVGMSGPRIKRARISAMPKSFTDPLPGVEVTYENGEGETLFTFYPDELSFTGEEFVGLTREQAMRLRHDKDVAYLRS